MKKLFASLLAIAMSTSLAGAADLPARNLPVQQDPVILPLFAGFFLGGYLGGTSQKTNIVETPLCGVPCGEDRFGSTTTGPLGGIQGGYNFQVSSFVFGIQASFEASNLNNRTTFPCCAPDYVNSRKLWEASLRARAGYAFGPLLPYITGGLALGQFQQTYYLFPSGAYDRFTNQRTGWTIGAGVEYLLTPNWSIMGEYRYTDFGHVTNVPPLYGSFSERHSYTENGLRFGANYRF